MNTTIHFTIALALSLPVGAGVFGATHEHGGHEPAAATTPAPSADADWLATAKAAYPLDTCVVSGDKLEDGEMGPPIDFVYKVEGQPDRLVRFCCKSCVRDFKKDPAQYLAMIDAAAAKKASGHGAGMEHPEHPKQGAHSDH